MFTIRTRRRALVELLATLDNLAEAGNKTATLVAADIRANGREAVERHLVKSARAVMVCTAWLQLDPIITAIADFDEAVTGHDWRQAKEQTQREAQQRVLDWLDRIELCKRDIARRVAARRGHRDLERLHGLTGSCGCPGPQ